MQDTRKMEITVGVFVALGLAALLMLAMKVANLSQFTSHDGYEVRAYFDNVGGLQVRAPVKMGGVTVGRVVGIGYDAQRFQAVVRMSIDPDYDHIPTDTAANIYTAGLLGEQYIGLEPGGEDTSLKGGDELQMTQSALVLEKALQEFLYNKTVKSP
ncbi:MAG TPA: outer membrane lipid asymmetry maintenance protein MlaD [Gammaproteobacteria bacterium]|nr:outer membrane lipid asymmetry maintenance protein MlaD [Gammaproteobacteria bacterium]